MIIKHYNTTISYINLILCLVISILLYTYSVTPEHFITWFSHKDTRSKPDLPKTYTCRRHFIKQDVVIGTYNYKGLDIYSNKFTHKLIDILLHQSNIKHIKTRKFDTDDIIYENLLNGTVDIGLVSTPVIYDKMKTTVKYGLKLKPINFITSMNTLFIYFIVSQLGRVVSIHDIKNGKKIGIDKKTPSWLCAKHIFDYMKLQETIDYVFVNDTYKKNARKVNRGEIDCLIQTDIYPSKHITSLFSNNLDNTLRLLPLDEINQHDFASKYVFYKPGYINLHRISDNYTPKIIGKFKYTTFKPMLTTYTFNNYLLGSDKVNNDVGLSVIKTVFDNIDNINKLPSMKQTPLDKYNLVHDFLYIPLNKGVITYYYEHGYITDHKDPACKHLVGNMKCSKHNLDVVTSKDIIV